VEKVKEIFERSTLADKIKDLQDPKSPIASMMSDSTRLAQISMYKALKTKQDLLNVCNIIAEYGPLGQEALSLFCRDCPEEVYQTVNLGLAVTDIVGNVAAGNIASAAMNAIGLFKGQGPSAEQQMLTQISNQLRSLEKGMNSQFKLMHERLFKTEQTLLSRIDTIDAHMIRLSYDILNMKTEVLQGLSILDSKLDYIQTQNECTQNLILQIVASQNQDACKIPVLEFKNSLANNAINSFEDLENFYDGWNCQKCVDVLSNVSNTVLISSPLFQYSKCNFEGESNKARPDRIYEFLFKLLDKQTDRDNLANAILAIPKTVRIADPRSNGTVEKKVISLVEQDRSYRDYEQVLTYADYVLTMFTFIELYDNGIFSTPEMIRNNPGFTVERSDFMKTSLEQTIQLVNHTIFQQLLLTGNGLFEILTEQMEAGIANVNASSDEFSIADVFRYNPYLRKNYSSYLLDRNIGYEKLVRFAGGGPAKKRFNRIGYNGYSFLLREDKNENIYFEVSLTDLDDPQKSRQIFNCHSPINSRFSGQENYLKALEFSLPNSVVRLIAMKQALMDKLAEMNVITSSTLDEPNAKFSRADLKNLVSHKALLNLRRFNESFPVKKVASLPFYKKPFVIIAGIAFVLIIGVLFYRTKMKARMS
jgi:hypothetical protein